ncbi:beta-ketoacyl-[acyl-carrier-protein] synthase family protein [Amycolatopsis pigmentata]|uniref:Beta-ketoacyl-[acyl-carrier-protein] synthase family protein n=1 Tax=Amycolatopsis pigmentata TaxID=450801 RepID=A0ABW5FQN7_9PSEU
MVTRVVVTGVGVVSPLGNDFSSFWKQLVDGTSAVEVDPWLVRNGFRTTVSCRVPGFDVADGTRVSALALEAARQCAADAHLDGIAAGRLGVVFTSVNAGMGLIESREWGAALFAGHTTGLLREFSGAGGGAVTVSTGCSAGLDAVSVAVDWLRGDDLDAVLVVAAESPFNRVSVGMLDNIGALAAQPLSCPFDARRSGMVLAEAGAAVVVERLGHARAREARPYAEITAVCGGNNALHMSDLPEDGAPLSRVIGRALAEAAARPDGLDLICAHGTSTVQNDVFETSAIKSVLGERARTTPVTSGKGAHGHALAASGLLAVLSAAGSLRDGVIAPTANYAVPDPRCDLDYVGEGAREKPVGRVLLLANGLAGVHTAAVLGRVRGE